MTHLTRRTFLTATATALGAVTLAQPARAATHTVNIQGHSFSPANLTISAGDTVTFINKDGAPHTATADNGSFDTGRLGRNDSASLTFNSSGTTSYFCAIHPSMKGSITVS